MRCPGRGLTSGFYCSGLLLIGPLKTDLNPHTGGVMAGISWEATPKSSTGENSSSQLYVAWATVPALLLVVTVARSERVVMVDYDKPHDTEHTISY